MSNASFRFERQFKKFFPGFRSGIFVLIPFFCLTVLPTETLRSAPLVDRQKLEGIDDDSPLARSGDKEGWDYLFRLLREHSQEEIEKNGFDTVGFTELNRQPVEYRGRVVRITGKLLRCDFVPQRRETSPFDNGESPSGYYESWVLVKDRKQVPIAVCSLDIPKGFPTGDGLDEPVAVTGVFYKRQLFLSADNEEVTTPTILAKTLKWQPVPKESKKPDKERDARSAQGKFAATLALLILLWIAFRVMGKRIASGRRNERIRFRFSDRPKKDDGQTDGVEQIKIPVIIDTDGKTGDDKEEYETVVIDGHITTIITTPKPEKPSSGAVIFFILAVQAAAGTAFAQVPQHALDAEFTKVLLKMDELSWDALGDENVPLQQQREPVLGMLAGLTRSVPGSFLKNGVSMTFPAKDRELSALVRDPAQYRGKAFELRGHVVGVEEISLDPVEKKNCRFPRAFRCRFQIDENSRADVICAFVPSGWKRNEPIRERASFTGIYIKRVPDAEKKETDAATETPALFEKTPELLPLFVAPRLRWFPDDFLGNLGFDAGSFEQVPPLRISDLKKQEPDVSPSLELLGRSEIIRRAFKFTEADTAPFYGLLKATRLTPPGRIEREARTEMEKDGRKQCSAVELFNHPEKTRGKPVLLYGIAKRVMTTLVEDKEVRELYGIDKYYQIYLYTDDSQGNPIIVCTTSLPEGMPDGTLPDYAERISVAAIPYKLWVYETEAELDNGEGHKPSFAPLLIGRCPQWYPDEKKRGPLAIDPDDPRSALTFGIFVVLMAVWLFFRRFKSNRKIEFKLKK